jgi:hypothetical protein
MQTRDPQLNDDPNNLFIQIFHELDERMIRHTRSDSRLAESVAMHLNSPWTLTLHWSHPLCPITGCTIHTAAVLKTSAENEKPGLRRDRILQVGARQPGLGPVAAVPRHFPGQPRRGSHAGAVVWVVPASRRQPLAAHGGLARLGDLAQVCLLLALVVAVLLRVYFCY